MPRIGKSWRSRLAVSSFLVVFLYSALSPAELKLFPMWEQKQCPTDTFACYTFEQSKDIIKIDLDLQLKLKELDFCNQTKVDLDAAIRKMQAASAKDAEIIADLNVRLEEKQSVLSETTVKLVKAESRSIWNYLPWIIGGTLVLIAGAFAGGWYVGSR
jgi:hypothetical protein